MNEITKLNFNRKHFIKKVKRKFDNSLIVCKINQTEYKSQIESTFKKIVKKLNTDFIADKIFDNKMIYTYIKEIEVFFAFLNEYGESMQATNSKITINDSVKRFIAVQDNFLIRLNKEFNPYQCLIQRRV